MLEYDFDPLAALGRMTAAKQRQVQEALLREQNEKLDAIRSGQSKQAIQQEKPSGPPCPYCGEPQKNGEYELCWNCCSKLAWVDGHVCKPDDADNLREQLKSEEAKAQRVRDSLAVDWGGGGAFAR